METTPFRRRAMPFSNPANRIYLKTAIAATILQFIAFKTRFPRAGFINGDSYVYLQSAIFNSDINTYPVGYSKFLRIFSAFTRSDTALIAFQYFAIEAAALALLFTLFEIFSPSRPAKWIMFAFATCNPAFLYVANYVSSDAIFLTLSLTWFIQLLQLLKCWSPKLLISHAIVLLLAFMTRYNALYYPAISSLAFLLSRISLKKKLLSIIAIVSPIVLYMLFITNTYYQFTGIREFTAFSGWQLANNALYAYRYVDDRQLTPLPKDLALLDRQVRHYFDTTRDVIKHPEELVRASTIYMWDAGSPLQKFMYAYTRSDTAAGFFKRWATMGPLYTRYGYFLIKSYPHAWFKFYFLQNAIKFYTPPGEFLDDYNMGRDTVATVAQNWFRYPSQHLAPAYGNYKITILGYMPILSAILNILFLLGYPGLLMVTGLHLGDRQQKVLFLAFVFWTVNFLFSVVAAPVTLRYQVFAILVTGFFALLISDKLWRLAMKKPQ